MRKCWTGVLLLLLWAGVLQAERVQDLPRPANYVNDFAGVLSPGVQNSLDALCTQVDRQAHAQIAVVTIKTLDGEPIENFATELEDKWKVGPKGSDRGVLLILAINDRQRRIEVGYGLEGILPDAKAGDIGREMVPYLQQGNYDQAVTLAVTQMAQIIASDAGVNLSNSSPSRAASAPGADSHARRLDRPWDLFPGGHPFALPPRWIRAHWFSAGHVYGRRWAWRRRLGWRGWRLGRRRRRRIWGLRRRKFRWWRSVRRLVVLRGRRDAASHPGRFLPGTRFAAVRGCLRAPASVVSSGKQESTGSSCEAL